MMKRKAKYIAAAVAAAFAVAAVIFWNWKQGEHMRFVEKMGSGINVGNALDSTNLRDYKPDAPELEYETFWGNPPINRELFHTIYEAGFRTVRIPVTWEDHIDEDATISSVWLCRVQEVVDMALEEGLFVILNTHHEEWLNLETDKEDKITGTYCRLWEQLAEQFAAYDNRLLFEGMNEPRLRDSAYEWTGEDEELRAMVNRLNAAFVKTVRQCGGENEKRYLMIGAYANLSTAQALEDLKVPKGNIIISAHAYLPYLFCQQEDGTALWSAQNPEDVQEITAAFETMNRLFIKNNIPVILTEFGCIDKDNLQVRVEWTRYYVRLAREKGIQYIWWDNGSSFGILDRENGGLRYPELVRELVE